MSAVTSLTHNAVSSAVSCSVIAFLYLVSTVICIRMKLSAYLSACLSVCLQSVASSPWPGSRPCPPQSSAHSLSRSTVQP